METDKVNHKLFITAEEIAREQGISEDQAGQLMKWLSAEARIEGVCCLERPLCVPYQFYRQMAQQGFIPSGSRRLVGLESLCRYLGIGQKQARRLAKENGWTVRKIRKNLRFDLVAVDRWIDANREPPMEVTTWKKTEKNCRRE